MMTVGAQFYTVRDYCKNLNDFSESLKKTADIGYTAVQISGTCGYEPEWLDEELKKNGLKCVITHTPSGKLISDAEKVAKEHDVFGCKYVGLGWYDFANGNKPEDFVKMYGPVAKKLRENGKYFMYHNHCGEFAKIGNKTILGLLGEMTSPEEIGFTLDTYWIQVGGGDPAQWIERFKGRVPCIHLKDFSLGSKMAVIGEGNINFDRVFEKAESSGTEYMLVEQDDCGGEDPFECLRRSYNNLKAFGFR